MAFEVNFLVPNQLESVNFGPHIVLGLSGWMSNLCVMNKRSAHM